MNHSRTKVANESLGFHPDGNLLIWGTSAPRPDEIHSFHGNHVEFTLVPLGDLLVTVVRFPGQLWNDSPWAHVAGNGFDPVVLTGPTERYGVTVCLVDTDTNLIIGIRFFTLGAEYSRALYRELQERLAAPAITLEKFYRLAMEYQAQYPKPQQLLALGVSHCKAGLKE